MVSDEIGENMKKIMRKADSQPISDAPLNRFAFLKQREKDEKPTDICIERGRKIVITDYKAIEKTFVHFGRVIIALKLNYQTNAKKYGNLQFEMLAQLIDTHSSEFLRELEIDGYFRNALKLHKKSFLKAKIVKLKDFSTYHYESFRLNGLFPVVKCLHIENEMNIFEYIDCDMPNLKQLSISTIGTPFINNADLNTFRNVLAKNPQINSLALKFSSLLPPEYIDAMSSMLPNLETFSLTREGFAMNNFGIKNEIRFGNVTTFSVSVPNQFPMKLTFPKLQSLHVRSHSGRIYGIGFMDFVQQYPQIMRLHLKSFQMNDHELQQLMIALPNLVELSFEHENCHLDHEEFISARFIEQVLGTHELLMHFFISYNNLDMEYFQIESVKLEGKWTMEDTSSGFLFQRKPKRF